jgi:hypothetical protein
MGIRVFIVGLFFLWVFLLAGKVSLRRYRLGGRLKKSGLGEIFIPTTYVLEHDINGLRAGIDPGS